MKKLIILYILILLFLSCKNNKKLVFDQDSFIANKQKWQETNIKNYKYQLITYKNKIIEDNAIIIVENGVYKENIPISNNFNINHYLNFSTIDKIYNWLESTSKENEIFRWTKIGVTISELYVEYDEENYIPKYIKLDIKAPFFVEIEGGDTIEVIDFEKYYE